MRSRPLIGITVSPRTTTDTSEETILAYCKVVADAGGLPVIIPLNGNVADYAEALDGWLIAGGRDVPPGEYGAEEAPETVPISDLRYGFERALWPLFVETGKPILGICYGCQFINVQLSGSLVQHIPTPSAGGVNHRTPESMPTLHSVKLESGSMVERACESAEFESCSSHHQTISEVGDALRIVGYAPDGTIEAIESADGKWLLGVQWHPERTPDSPDTQALMRAFVREAAKGGGI